MTNIRFILSLLIVATLLSCSKAEMKEKKFIKAMQSENFDEANQAYDDFCKWIQSDKSTMKHDFKLMRDALGMKVLTSDDGKVRLYSWVTSRTDSTCNYANLVQWLTGDNLLAYNGPLDAMLTKRKPNIKRQWSLAHSIDTLFEIQDAKQPIYMIVESYVNEEGMSFSYISAAVNSGITLSVLPFFFNGIETAGNREYIDNGKVNKADLIKWDAKAKKLYSYLTDDSAHVIPGQYEVYELSNDRFVKLDQELPTNQETTK
jgi:hypothetical protein